MKNLTLCSMILSAAILTLTTQVHAEGNHAGGHGHGSSHSGEHWASPKDAAARVNPIKSDQTSIDRGKKVYMASCINCHGVSAKGDGPLASGLIPKPTNLTLMAGKHSDGDFEWKIANGRGSMPAWKSFLKENQRWDVVNYIQSLENHSKMDHSKMDHSKMDHSKMDHSKMTKEEMLKMDHSNMTEEEMAGMDHSNMTEAELRSMGIHSASKKSSNTNTLEEVMNDDLLTHAKRHSDPTYVCPMHPQVIKGEPSNCPICGMNLVKKEVSMDEMTDDHKDDKHKH